MSAVQEVGDELFSITVPVPVIMKDVNIYIFRGEVPTLMDAGTYTPEVSQAIDEALQYLGIAVPAQILLTHWHVDHAGGAARLQQQGAEIIVGRKDFAEWTGIEQPGYFAQLEKQLCEQWGVPDREGFVLSDIYLDLNRFSQLPQRVKFTGDGEMIKAGNMWLQVIECPGHSAGHLCFYNRSGGLLFTGDQLLATQITYPGVWLEDSRLVNGSIPYLKSLEKLEKLPAHTYFPGHGSPGSQPAQRCREVFEQVLGQSRRYLPGKDIYSTAYSLCKDRFSPDRLFINLHLVAGWEEISRYARQSANREMLGKRDNL